MRRFQPAFGGVDFTVLLFLAVLGEDELRTQRDGVGLAGGNNDRGDRAVEVSDLSVLVLDALTIGAVNISRLRGEIFIKKTNALETKMSQEENEENQKKSPAPGPTLKSRPEPHGRMPENLQI